LPTDPAATCQRLLMTFLRWAMLPAPARIAATPSPKSRASWNPAVPPPPVGGAAVRNGLAAGLRVADGLAEGLAVAVGGLTLAVPLGRILGVAEALLPGENVVGVAEGEDAEQAETDAEASMVNAAQLAAVNLALSPAPTVVVRIFMGPPHAGNAHGRHRHVTALSPLEISGYASRTRWGRQREGRRDWGKWSGGV
jgi:hypothetical protein